MTGPSAIGGVMAAEPARQPTPGSLWQAWSAPFEQQAAFANARSALAALLQHHHRDAVWLPAYACPSLAEGARRGAQQVRFFPIGPDLEPENWAWASEVGANDAVVVIDYFGRPPSAAWRALRAKLPEALWIEDRAQALETAAPPLGQVVLYSPRKLVGVGDGGLLFGDVSAPAPSEPGDDQIWAPEDARIADPGGHAAQLWRPLFQSREATMGVTQAAASSRTLRALKAIQIALIAARRQANWRQLAQQLQDYALWPITEPSFAPLAFPILVDDADAAVRALAAERIWAPRHWADPPSDAAKFPAARWLAAHCVSLPLDQRYGEAEMDRIAAAVISLVTPAARSSSRSRPKARRSRRA